MKNRINDKMALTWESVKRVDDKGILYEMNYLADYYDPSILDALRKHNGSLRTGCSAFSTYNMDHEFLFCRNYDYRHLDSNGETTSLNLLIHFAPEGKLRSLGICDGFWLNPSAYYAGTLDDGITDRTNLFLAPYMCVDGINEAGLAVSLLVADVKEGEHLTDQNTGKQRITHSMLLRYMMDNAHNIEEACELARAYDIYSTGDTDLHIFLCEKSGASAVFEWRQYGENEKQELYVTYTNAVTNFYVGFADGRDVYGADGSLVKVCPKLGSSFNGYKYGYGHGYHRFNQIISSLEMYIEKEKNEYGIRNSVMEESQARDILSVAAQGLGIENTSFTQYSAIYNLKELSVSIWLQRDYKTVYTFDCK